MSLCKVPESLDSHSSHQSLNFFFRKLLGNTAQSKKSSTIPKTETSIVFLLHNHLTRPISPFLFFYLHCLYLSLLNFHYIDNQFRFGFLAFLNLKLLLQNTRLTPLFELFFFLEILRFQHLFVLTIFWEGGV